MAYQTLETIERRRRVIRIALFVVIIGTMPFYCAGFLLWGTAGPSRPDTSVTLATSTPIGNNLAATLTRQPTQRVPITITIPSPLQPTPLQFNPGFGGGGGSTGGGSTGGGGVILPPTIPPPVFIPTSTFAPTLTPFPTNPPLPTATQTPLPTEPPLPTNTPEPLPTEAPPPTAESVLPPDDTGTGEITAP